MDYKKAGDEIRKLRKARKITQKQLGDAIMRSESSIAKYEQGLVDIPPSVLLDIANFLGVDAIDLLGAGSVSSPPSISSVAFKWLESLGYKVVFYEEDGCNSLSLRDLKTYKEYTLSDDTLKNLIDNIASYSRFQIQEALKTCEQNDSSEPTDN